MCQLRALRQMLQLGHCAGGQSGRKLVGVAYFTFKSDLVVNHGTGKHLEVNSLMVREFIPAALYPNLVFQLSLI